MSEFDYTALSARIAQIKDKYIDLSPLVKRCNEALHLLEKELRLSGFLMPSEFLDLHEKKAFLNMKAEGERLVAHYRLLYMIGFLYGLLAYTDAVSPLDLLNIEKARLSFQTFDQLNRDEKIVFLLSYRFKDFRATSRWLRENKEFLDVARELEAEKELILAEVDRHFLGN